MKSIQDRKKRVMMKAACLSSFKGESQEEAGSTNQSESTKTNNQQTDETTQNADTDDKGNRKPGTLTSGDTAPDQMGQEPNKENAEATPTRTVTIDIPSTVQGI